MTDTLVIDDSVQTLTNKTIEDLKVSGKVYLDFDSDTYFEYNSETEEVELYVGGTIKASW